MTQEVARLKLTQALKECDRHWFHLRLAYEEVVHFKALRKGAHENLSNEQIRTLDQLLFRFGRLQDAMGLRLLPSLLVLLAEWREGEPFLDKLNRAEQLGILPSAEGWQVLRELRNHASHDYPDNPEVMLSALVNLIQHIPDLEKSYLHISRVARFRI